MRKTSAVFIFIRWSAHLPAGSGAEPSCKPLLKASHRSQVAGSVGQKLASLRQTGGPSGVSRDGDSSVTRLSDNVFPRHQTDRVKANATTRIHLCKSIVI